ncbi:enoyl-CoA hydratase/isomerase family protein [Cecembia calidifontis]|jgi:methylglutaconyl-CoA hydratase|uniref:Methylglutaconyl-CoA hydratase n=1 Tax=Cecembia calidifontis TaxID=1187080 RepID=A0A4Q7PE46_9BACT|nr:enoyl-CoA hydratase/isomerase family protein [Cecembia calidifontis]RZS98713.1 methylglutaconyl-CoA hydratase [Cecembia calidifontis]
MSERPIITYKKDRIGYLELNRPEKRNALNSEMVEALKTAISEFEKDREVKVLVIKAAGKVFCSGADLAYLQSLQTNSYEENLLDSNNLKELFYRIYTSPKVIIAQIQGHALAGGCGLATVCDFSFTVPEAKFGYTEVKIGFVPAIVKVFLLRKIGEGKAKQLLLDGDLIDAKEAQSLGLINWIVEAGVLEEKVYEYAQKLIEQNSEQSMALTKEMIGRVQEKSLEDGLDYAAAMNARARGSEDCKKGIAAFLNKEPISW